MIKEVIREVPVEVIKVRPHPRPLRRAALRP